MVNGVDAALASKQHEPEIPGAYSMKFQIAVSHSIPSRIVRGNARQAKYVGSGPIRSGLVRSGLTLIEIMIALTMTLIVLGAMMTAFQYASEQMTMGRAKLELTNRMRGVENLLRSDLANLTVEPRPYIEGTIPNGYFEYVEGPRRDLRGFYRSGVGSADSINEPDQIGQDVNYLGDFDDMLAMTVRSSAGQVFRGRFLGGLVESSYAEVIWWTSFSDNNADLVVDLTDSVSVRRRVLIINPDLPLPTAPMSYTASLVWLSNNDVSVRIVPATATTYLFVANTLQDLANRRNRFGKFSDEDTTDADDVPDSPFLFPYPTNRGALLQTSSSSSNDILLTDVAAFDIKVFSPDCVGVLDASGILTEPGDPQFPNLAGANDADGDGLPATIEADDGDAQVTNLMAGFVRTGAYVDLGHSGGGQFSRPWAVGTILYPFGHFTGVAATSVQRAPLNYQFNFHEGTALPAVLTGLLETAYDTWTPGYESDGINQDPNTTYFGTNTAAIVVNGGDADIDEGTDGVDNDGFNGVDDYFERETRPPYPDPIRGLKVTLRLIEKNTQQLEQTSIEHSFVPQ